MKKRILKKSFMLLAVLGLVSFNMNGQETFSTSDLGGWSVAYGAAGPVTHSQTEGVKGDGALVLTRDSNNSNFGLGTSAGIDADTYKYIKIRYKNETLGTDIRVQGSKDAANTVQLSHTIYTIAAGTPGNGVWKTAFIDMSSTTNWNGTVNNLDILIRRNYAAGEGNFYVDEIEFVTSDKNYSEFVQSPSFEDGSGTAIFSDTASQPVDLEIEASANAKDGINNLKLTWTGDATAGYFIFSSFQKTYGGVDFPVGTILQVKMWVKKNTANSINIISRIKTEELDGATSQNKTATQNTSTAVNTWEQLTFDIPITAASDAFTNWIGIGYDAGGGTSNLTNGDIIQIDKITSAVFPVSASTTPGNWATGGTWGGAVPNQGDKKTINNNIDVNSAVVSDGPIEVTTGNTLTIKAGNSLTLNSDIQIDGTLNLEHGAQLIVKGNSAGNASFVRTLPAANGGDATLDGWFSMSPPFSGASINNAWATSNGLATSASNNRGLATYVENGDSWAYLKNDDTNVAALGSTFQAGKGYIIKQSTAGDITFTGTINSSEDGVEVAVTKDGNGFNLLGSPYSALVNSGQFITDNTTKLASQEVWIWNDDGNTYNSKPTAMNFKLAPGQAFFVQVNAAGSLKFEQSNQEIGGDTFQKSSERKITLNVTDGANKRYAEVYYFDNATKGFDSGYEGKVFKGTSQKLSIYTQMLEGDLNESYQVQSFPNSDFETNIIPVGLKAEAGKEVTITAEALNIPSGLNVYLEDRVASTFTRLDEVNSEYKITLTEAINGVGRFYLHTRSSALSVDDSVKLNGVSIFKLSASTLRVAGLPNGKASVSLFNVLGKQVLTNKFEANGAKDILLPKLAAGVYFVNVETVSGKISKKIILE
ncbi:T9SS type A sorting domain-containing protein [Polaribacter sp. Z022]|uniref:T9SS type A sorting domain-containing protein n=1 Tax=Polaribacter sp. Z022 TaxID=2927125 RepID=UPI002022178E|nr:T9SS type A sorting domain-containing protein [Polaribacter sp. Z022]MCL7754585.1 T9SS type A sorting domain-containing protein [Polaribacter sp. Z022]